MFNSVPFSFSQVGSALLGFDLATQLTLARAAAISKVGALLTSLVSHVQSEAPAILAAIEATGDVSAAQLTEIEAISTAFVSKGAR